MDPLRILLTRHALSVQAIQAETRPARRMVQRIQLSELEAAILDMAAKLDRLAEIDPDLGRIDPEDEIVRCIHVSMWPAR